MATTPSKQKASKHSTHRAFNENCSECWDRRLRRSGLSMSRGNPGNRLTYVDPSKLDKLEDLYPYHIVTFRY